VAQRRLRERIAQFLREEAPAVIVTYSTIADTGNVFGSSGGSYMAAEHHRSSLRHRAGNYNRIARLSSTKSPVKPRDFDIRQIRRDGGAVLQAGRARFPAGRRRPRS